MATNVCSADAVSFYVLNPTSLVKPSALLQLAIELAQFNIGLAIITETWFNDRHVDQFVNIAGYYTLRKDRQNKKGGGSGVPRGGPPRAPEGGGRQNGHQSTGARERFFQ
jgi:hypothetical protein